MRLTRIREALEAMPRSVAQLAEVLAVTPRTVQRDLETLQREMGLPLERDERGRYRIPQPRSELNDVEVLATFSAVRLLLHTGIGDRHYRSSMQKLAAKLPDAPRSVLTREIEPLTSDAQDRVFEFVAQAWIGRRVLRCAYGSVHVDQEARLRDLEVHHFEINRTNLAAYVVARDRSDLGRMKIFKLVRMSDVRLTDQVFDIDPDFDPRAHLSGSFGIVPGEVVWVDVRVDRRSARAFLEQRQDAIEEVGWGDDGSLLARVRGTRDAYGRVIELLPYLLGWGASLEVLAPADVRSAVAEGHRAAAAFYDP
jgi:predicted DNA-binding transcriptional regulator YafY